MGAERLREVRGGLTPRLVVACAVLAVVLAAPFAVLLSSVSQLGDLQHQARQSERILVGANRLEKLVVDVEASQSGFVITGQDVFLRPWQAAREAIPARLRELEGLVADNPAELATVRQLHQTVVSYLEDFSVPLVTAARTDPAAIIVAATTRMDALRADFDRFVATETLRTEQRQNLAATVDRQTSVTAATGFAASTLLIVAFAAYLGWAIARPIRRVAVMAGRIAGGDLDVGVAARGPGEVGMLQRGFNAMAAAMRHGQAELRASRVRIVAAGDQARRRIERDLHDGVQQGLVTLVLELRTIEAELPAGIGSRLGHIADGLSATMDELRELSRGIHPVILSDGGLGAAIKALGRRCAVPVELDLDVPTRLAEAVEVAAYYVVSEALTNAAKHAEATLVHVTARCREDRLHLAIHDDGVGGATPARGSGLIGLKDRVEALGGTLTITSPAGEGTELAVDVPVR